ncbi:MAG: FhaA domain-containing protein [Acidimicrobiales bacterium]
MGIRGFERRLERMVEGAFARAFKSGLRPVELGRRLVREMDDNRSVGVRGGTVVPNAFVVALSASDLAQFEGVQDSLARELGDAAREHARDEGYSFMGPVEVDLVEDERLHTGAFHITGRMVEGTGGAGAGSLVLPNGDRFSLTESVISVGRHPDCNLVLADPNVSRNHAEIRPQGDRFAVIDLGSTNGTRVNGVRVDTQLLEDGDEISFGNTRIRFEAS